MDGFAGRGWARVSATGLADWARAVWPAAVAAVAGSSDPWRCGGTWFAGVDALDNDSAGRVPGGPALPLLQGPAFAPLPMAGLALHRAQISVTRPGYPQAWDGESDAAFRFRLRRDAAHLDGLLPVGAARRRMIREPHGWILGVALTECDAGASPLVVWEGSHRPLRAALAGVLADHPAQDWSDVDVTDAYQAARAGVFDTCRRLPVSLARGEAVVLHRHLLHGIAPWAAGAIAPPEGRIMAYFRPLMPSVAAWMSDL